MADITDCISRKHVFNGLDEQRKDGVLTDIILQIDDKQFKAHKNVLGTISEYFKVMFVRGFKEQNAHTVRLDHTPISAEAFEVILNAIYCAKLHLTTQTIHDIIVAMDFLQMDKFMPKCEHFLLSNISMQTCLEYYEIANKYQLKHAAKASRSFVVKNFIEFYKTYKFRNMTYESLLDILSAHDLNLNGEEIVVFRAACSWLQVNYVKSEVFAVLCDPKYVDYRIIPEERIRNELLTNKLVESDKDISTHISGVLSNYHSSSPLKQPDILEAGRRPRGVSCFTNIEIGDAIPKLVFRQVGNTSERCRTATFPVTMCL